MPQPVIVISGGNGFLGSAISELFLKNGFRVVSLDRDGEFAVDISDEGAVQAAAERIKKEFGDVFAVIHAASAPIARKSMLFAGSEDLEAQFRVNVIGAFNLAKSFSEILGKDGCFIGISSSAALPGMAHSKNGSYAVAKIALQGFLRVLSSESPYRVYSVAPVFMSGGLNKDLPKNMSDLIAAKDGPSEVTSPEEVAKTVLSLLNDTERKWNGKTVKVPGLSATSF